MTDGGFFLVDRATVLNPKLSAHARLTYLALVSDADAEGLCTRSQAGLVDDIGLSRSSVQRGLRELQQAGVIDVENRFTEAGLKTVGGYRVLHLPEPAPEETPGQPDASHRRIDASHRCIDDVSAGRADASHRRIGDDEDSRCLSQTHRCLSQTQRKSDVSAGQPDASHRRIGDEPAAPVVVDISTYPVPEGECEVDTGVVTTGPHPAEPEPIAAKPKTLSQMTDMEAWRHHLDRAESFLAEMQTKAGPLTKAEAVDYVWLLTVQIIGPDNPIMGYKRQRTKAVKGIKSSIDTLWEAETKPTLQNLFEGVAYLLQRCKPQYRYATNTWPAFFGQRVQELMSGRRYQGKAGSDSLGSAQAYEDVHLKSSPRKLLREGVAHNQDMARMWYFDHHPEQRDWTLERLIEFGNDEADAQWLLDAYQHGPDADIAREFYDLYTDGTNA